MNDLAIVFRDEIRRALTAEQLVMVDALNSTPAYAAACASHDYVDANMHMARAFSALNGRPFSGDDDDTDAVNRAWDQARSMGFSDTLLEIVEHATTVDDIDLALQPIMQRLGVTDGGFAGTFDWDGWPTQSDHERRRALAKWIQGEVILG